jgi:putative membrane protein
MPSFALILGQIGPRAGQRMDWNDGHPAGRIIFMIIVALIFIGLIVGVVVALRRTSRSHTSAAPATTSATAAREILDQRFARGEIEPADYEERKRLLG